MDKQAFFDVAASLPGSTDRYKEEWEAHLLEVGGKMYAMIGRDKQGEDIITIKAEPADGELLRASHDYIIPGYYMNKTHWNSVYYHREVNEELVHNLLRESHAIVLSSLSKKAQAAIKG